MWLRRDDMRPEYVKCYFESAKNIIFQVYFDYSGFYDKEKFFFGAYIKELGAHIYGGKIKFSTLPNNARNIIKFEEFLKWVGTENKRKARK